MVWRRRVIFTRSSRAASSTGRGAAGALTTGAGAGAAAAAAMARATSSFIARPSLPVPVTASRGRPASAIAFLAAGASSTSLFDGADGAGAAEALEAGADALTAPPMTASLALASTVVPSGAVISESTPAAGEGTSTETLSVSSSQSISSAATVSPTCLNHVETVASDTDSPKAGTMTSTAALLGAAAAGATAAGATAAVPPSVIIAKSASTPTVSPSFATISPKVPAAGAGTSTVTLSVSSSQSISSASTRSPGFLNHVATVASVTDSPSVGTRTSVLMIFLRL